MLTRTIIRRREVDLGICTLSYLKPGLKEIPLFSRSDVVICHPEHPLAGRREVFLKDLEPYHSVLLDQNCSSRKILDEACEKAKAKLSIAMELSSIEVVKSFVSIGAGISVVPEVAVHEEVEAGKLVSIRVKDFDKAGQTRMGVIYRTDRYLSTAARSFLHMLQKNAVTE